jgi:hypothetical protein
MLALNFFFECENVVLENCVKKFQEEKETSIQKREA